MKILPLEQNTEEWLEWRKGKSGGSEFGKLWIPGLPRKEAIIEKLEADGQPLTPEDKRSKVADLAAMLSPEELAELKLALEPKEKFYQLIAERVARPITPNDYADRLDGVPFSMMARGHLLEPEAIQAFVEKTGKQVDANNYVWVSEEDPNAYVSPDAYSTSEDGKIREAVEVKCLDSAGVVKAYLTGTYPKEYEAQVLKYFIINEDLETLYFIIYTDVIPGLELQIFEIRRGEVEDRLNEAKMFELAILKVVDEAARKIERLSF